MVPERLEAVPFIKGHGFCIRVNCNKAHCGDMLAADKHSLYNGQTLRAYAFPLMQVGNGKSAYFNCRITIEMLAVRECLTQFSP